MVGDCGMGQPRLMGPLQAVLCCSLLVLATTALLHFSVFCQRAECNIFHYVDILLSERQLLIYHYRCRSYEDFVHLRMGKAYDERVAIKGMGFDRASNESKSDMLKRVFLKREAGAGCLFCNLCGKNHVMFFLSFFWCFVLVSAQHEGMKSHKRCIKTAVQRVGSVVKPTFVEIMG